VTSRIWQIVDENEWRGIKRRPKSIAIRAPEPAPAIQAYPRVSVRVDLLKQAADALEFRGMGDDEKLAALFRRIIEEGRHD
jgi:hypothetical protein